MPVHAPGANPVSVRQGGARRAVYSPLAWVAGTAFNVLIDARQVFDCQDRIFADGFD